MLKLKERAKLAIEVYDAVVLGTESLSHDDIGVSLAYLMGAILKDGAYETMLGDEFTEGLMKVLREAFSEASHPLWSFIDDVTPSRNLVT